MTRAGAGAVDGVGARGGRLTPKVASGLQTETANSPFRADAVTALEKLEAELVEAEDAESKFNYLDDQLGAVKEAYAALKGAAKADLVLEARTPP